MRIYFGCEGQSEQSYGKLLHDIADAAGLHLHLDTDVLQPGGGSPLAIIELAIRHIDRKKKIRGDFAHRALFLDRDKLGERPEWQRQTACLAQQHALHLIWQDPSHEAFLLRHLQGQSAARPPNSDLAFQTLKRFWPDYVKGMAAIQLATRIDREAIDRARMAEAGLAAFLDQIGFPRV